MKNWAVKVGWLVAALAIAACRTPTTDDEAVKACSASRTFIYYDSFVGLTGQEFSIFIDDNGEAEFNDKNNERPVVHYVKLSRSTLNGLTAKIQASELFHMKNWYGPPPNDGASINLVVCLEGRSKEITYEPGASDPGVEHTPHTLLELDQAILEAIGASRWIRAL